MSQKAVNLAQRDVPHLDSRILDSDRIEIANAFSKQTQIKHACFLSRFSKPRFKIDNFVLHCLTCLSSPAQPPKPVQPRPFLVPESGCHMRAPQLLQLCRGRVSSQPCTDGRQAGREAQQTSSSSSLALPSPSHNSFSRATLLKDTIDRTTVRLPFSEFSSFDPPAGGGFLLSDLATASTDLELISPSTQILGARGATATLHVV